MTSIIIHEAEAADGAVLRTSIVRDRRRGEALALEVGGDVLPLPDGAIAAVMKRFGKPLGIGEDEMHVVETLDLGDGARLVRFRFLRRYDVIARDYLAFYAPGDEPLCELATAVSGALDHLARAWRSRTPPAES